MSPSTPSALLEPGAPRARVLVVDDDEVKRYTTVRTLERAGYDVREAKTGAEGLLIARELPDLIVLDVKLPDLDGFEVCRRLKAEPHTHDIPVVHLSAELVQPQDRVRGIEGGADGYLVT